MRKRVYKIFLNALDGQEKWLNEMADQGWELVRTTRFMYEFQACSPSAYRYRVEFVAQKSYQDLENYRMFLGEMGMIGYTKNLNIGKYSFGQIKLRPFGKGMGMIATSPGTINKELFILKKVNDGKPFDLHTDFEDKIEYYQNIRNALLTIEILFTGAFMMNLGRMGVSDLIYAVFVLGGGIILFKYLRIIRQLKKDRVIQEK